MAIKNDIETIILAHVSVSVINDFDGLLYCLEAYTLAKVLELYKKGLKNDDGI